ncbi:MAG: DUF881 domain-containing protein [Clostridia bacterium]|nr:DUF881 domain-containing protein [Clostridia bacterium]
MKKLRAQLALGFVFLLLAFLITIQFRTVTQNSKTQQQTNLRVDELMTDLKKEREKNEVLQKQLSAYENDIAQYREDMEQSSGYSKFLSEQLKRAEISAGMSELVGPGVIVSLSDVNKRKAAEFQNSASTLIHDEDIRRIVNELWSAGAEAISINGSRIITTTSIRCVGPTVLINDKKMAPPYVISAIGNAEQLEAALNLNGGVIDTLRVWEFEISISKSEKITLPKYDGVISHKYAQPVTITDEKGGNKQ